MKNVKYQRIKELRKEKDLSQEKVSEFLGVAQNTYSQYEIGMLKLSADCVARLAEFYGVSADYILNLSDKRKRR